MQTKLIKNKIKSATNIKKITKTMEMVSVAKMKRAIELANNTDSFLVEAENILDTLSNSHEKSHFAKNNNSKNILCIVIAGQKGLCGGYNSSIYREVYKFVNQNTDKNFKFICIGKYAEKIARKFGDNILESFIEKDFKMSAVRNIIKLAEGEFVAENFSEVKVFYNNFINSTNYKSEVVNILPFKNPEHKIIEKHLAIYEPSAEVVYDKVINLVLEYILMGYVLRARAAEHSARMMAMKTASDNAGDMLSDLKLWYNKVRQAAITQEIAEISSGAMASVK